MRHDHVPVTRFVACARCGGEVVVDIIPSTQVGIPTMARGKRTKRSRESWAWIGILDGQLVVTCSRVCVLSLCGRKAK